jgi:hypothetical protein
VVAEECDKTVVQVVVNWTMQRKGGASVLCGKLECFGFELDDGLRTATKCRIAVAGGFKDRESC